MSNKNIPNNLNKRIDNVQIRIQNGQHESILDKKEYKKDTLRKNY